MLDKADRSVFLSSIAVVVVGLAGTWLVLSREPRQPDLVEVLVVRRDLPIDTLLDESAMQSHIGRARVRRDRISADAVDDERLVLGKRTNRTLRAGQHLSAGDVAELLRCMTVPDDLCQYTMVLGPDNWSTGTFKAGDRVDLFVGVRVGEDLVWSEPVAKGLLVLAVGRADPVISVATTGVEAEAIRTAEDRGDLLAVRVGGAE